jgi:hypothetical protein
MDGYALIACKERKMIMHNFRFELFQDGKLIKNMYTRARLIRALKLALGFLKDIKYDCVEIYKDGERIKEYGN